MNTLQLILEDPDLHELGLYAWDTFVKSLNFFHLGPLLSQIVVILLQPPPLGAIDPTEEPLSSISISPKAVAILEYLLVENEKNLSMYFDGIFFVPNHPIFRKINETLDSKKKELPEHLNLLIQGIGHEAPIVSEQALTKLRQVLSENQQLIHNMILSETTSPLINRLIESLLAALRKFSSNPKCQKLCCECLGEVGAIDPDRLEVSINESSKGTIDISTLKSRGECVLFACKFIEEQLVKVFRSPSNNKIQDQASYAIQELMKFCGFSDSSLPLTLEAEETAILGDDYPLNPQKRDPAMSPLQLWNTFNKQVLHAINPLRQSEYTISQNKPRHYEYPIFPKKDTFQDWVQAWTVDLSSKVTGEYGPKIIFQACRGVIRSDLNTALYALPFLVLHILINGSKKEKENILKEFLAVLSVNTVSDMSELCSQVIFFYFYIYFILFYFILFYFFKIIIFSLSTFFEKNL